MKIYLSIALAFMVLNSSQIFAQNVPVSLGFQLELPQDAELMGTSMRVTPWVGWIDPIGAYSKILTGYYEKESTSDEGRERQRLLRLGLEAGYIIPFPSMPYVFTQIQHIQLHNNDRRGDRNWIEWGVGSGAKWVSAQGFRIYGAIEYRFYDKHPKLDVQNDQWIQGQGFVSYLGMEWFIL